MKPLLSKHASPGFTVLEVLVAVFVLSCTVTAVLQLMLTGDRINARRQGISYATILASNQAETIRRQEESATLLGDTTYETNMNGLGFEVRRTRISPPETARPDTVIYLLEFSIAVTRKNEDNPLVHFRLLQGLHGK
jgi:Tfp pilus assembly protein PilV